MSIILYFLFKTSPAKISFYFETRKEIGEKFQNMLKNQIDFELSLNIWRFLNCYLYRAWQAIEKRLYPVPADLKSAVKKSSTYENGGFVIPQ